MVDITTFYPKWAILVPVQVAGTVSIPLSVTIYESDPSNHRDATMDITAADGNTLNLNLNFSSSGFSLTGPAGVITGLASTNSFAAFTVKSSRSGDSGAGIEGSLFVEDEYRGFSNSLHINSCNFERNISSPPKYLDRFVLDYSWECNFLPRYTILVNNIVYQAATDFYNRELYYNTGNKSMNLNIEVVPNDTYTRSLVIRFENTNISNTMTLNLPRPEFKIYPYIHDAAGTSDSPGRIDDIVLDDIVIKGDITSESEIQPWYNYLYIHGQNTGDTAVKQFRLVQIYHSLKKGYITAPIKCRFAYKNLFSQVNALFSSNKPMVIPPNISNLANNSEYTIYNGFTETEYNTNVVKVFNGSLTDPVPQKATDSIKLNARVFFILLGKRFHAVSDENIFAASDETISAYIFNYFLEKARKISVSILPDVRNIRSNELVNLILDNRDRIMRFILDQITELKKAFINDTHSARAVKEKIMQAQGKYADKFIELQIASHVSVSTLEARITEANRDLNEIPLKMAGDYIWDQFLRSDLYRNLVH